ncbi:hypothetical protein D1Y84_08075 [Acidipila sp. EB88]|nr:hypothetical protein D1Y84_08075 [Acidipila sp. EB88]
MLLRSCCAFQPALPLALLGALLPAAGSLAAAQSTPHQDAPQQSIPPLPGDGSGAFHTHHYRDLFAEQGKTPAETHAKIERAFQQLFHGDATSERVYFEAGSNADGPLAYITDWANNDARTEGMSYGMMIAVQLNHKREFDALWNWSNTFMRITDPGNPNVGYFAWSMNTDGTPRSTGPRPTAKSTTPCRCCSPPAAGATARASTTTRSRPIPSCAACATIHCSPPPARSASIPAISPFNTARPRFPAPTTPSSSRPRPTSPSKPAANTSRPQRPPRRRTPLLAKPPPAPCSRKSTPWSALCPMSARVSPTPPITCPPSTSCSRTGAQRKTAPGGPKPPM